jgi:uncharacterized membrane protein YfcA
LILEAQTMIVLGVVFFSSFIRSAFGFGDAVVAMPLLVLFLDLKTATPLVALVAFTIASTILLRNWRRVRLKSALGLIGSSLVGIPLGLLCLKGAHEEIMKGVLGAVILAFALFRLSSQRIPRLMTDRWAFLFGFVAGILGGAYNTNGPPVVIYGSLRMWPPPDFRATLQGYFLLTGIFILCGHFSAGLWTADVLKLFFCCLPVVLSAVLLGALANRRLPVGRFDRAVHILLVILSLFLLWDTFHVSGLP